MTASAVCRPLPSWRGQEAARELLINCVLEGGAYARCCVLTFGIEGGFRSRLRKTSYGEAI